MDKTLVKICLIYLFLGAVLAAGYVFPGQFNERIEEINERIPLTLRTFPERDFQLGLDLQGGAHLVYQADLLEVEERERGDRMMALRDLIERRVDYFGIGESLVQVRGDRLIVELPGVRDQQEAVEAIGETPFLDFRVLADEETLREQEEKILEIEEALGKSIEEATLEEITQIEGWEAIFQDPFVPTDLTGRYLERAQLNFDQMGRPIVSLRFDSEGAQILEEITRDNVGQPMATYLDGEQIQVANIQEVIRGGEAQISGGFSIEEAREIARNLQIGALPIPIELISQRSVGPTLGERSLEDSIIAGVVGLIMVIIFMVFYYRLSGVMASLSLIFYLIFLLFLFKVVPITMTLSGIAGLVLSIGMAIDANILIFSRMKEEMRDGASLKDALEEGISRAWPSIRDANITTFLVALILFFVSSSFVRGFATVLLLGILVSLFSSLIVTRLLIKSFENGFLSRKKRIWL